MSNSDSGDAGDPGQRDDDTNGTDRLRSLIGDPIELHDAPSSVWEGIAAEVALDDGGSVVSDPTSGSVARIQVVADPSGPDESIGPAVHGTQDRALRRHRSRRRAVLLGAAAVVVAVGVGIGVVAATRRDSGPTQVASAELTPFEGAPVGAAGGRIEVVRDDEQLRMRVDMHDLPAPAPGTFYELWLIDPTTGQPVSVATMKDGDSDVVTAVDLPAGTDTSRYDVVDVSVQQDGAGPQHSGDSVLRGTLTA